MPSAIGDARPEFACPGCEMIVQQQHLCVKCRSPVHQGCAKGYCRPDSYFGPGGRDPDAPPLPYNEDDRFCSPCWDQLLNTTKKKAKTSIFDSAPSSPSSGDDKKTGNADSVNTVRKVQVMLLVQQHTKRPLPLKGITRVTESRQATPKL